MSRSKNLHQKKTLQIEGTNDSSCLSKHSAASHGYFKDDYLQYFIQKQVRRAPLIHLGYCVRSSIISAIIDRFIHINQGQHAQVVSVGAGFDTLFFRSSNNSECDNFIFYEIDLPRVVDKKIKCIRLSERLQEIIGYYAVSGNILSSKKYYLIAADLRNLSAVDQLLNQCGIDLSLPTLFLSECAITYLEETSSTDFIKWASFFTNSMFVTYEQIHPDDGFGNVMINHFQSIGSPLQSVRKYPSLKDQEKRYRSNGWSHCESVSAYDAYTQLVPWEERLKVLLLEPFDEWEEVHLKCVHYTLTIGSHRSISDWFDLYFERPIENFNKTRENIKLKLIKVCNLNLYGHCAVSVNIQNKEEVLVFGGFGFNEESAHCRFKRLSRIERTCDENKDIIFNSEVVNKNFEMETLFATCSKVKSAGATELFIVYGGRASPKHYTNTCPILMEISDCYSVHCENLVDSCDMPPRWRHTAVVAKQGGVDMLLVFGGRTSKLQVLKDLWKLVLVNERRNRKVFTIDDNSNGPCARFSHSAAVRQCSEFDEMYISGGMDKYMNPLSDLWKLDLKTERWERVVTSGMIPRYGHTSHIAGTSLIMVGGVNTLDELQPGVGVVDILTGLCVEYSIPIESPEMPVMLINHTSSLSRDESVVHTFGGGGNCFSFGSFFNSFSVAIPLDQFK